jgi:hypothetical protein
MKSFEAMKLATMALLLTTAQVSQAQTVYRCGSSYSQVPCAGGTALQVDDPRSEAQRQASVQATARDMALAHTLEDTRRKDEALELEREKARQVTLAHQAAARKKQEERHLPHTPGHKKPPGLRSAKVQEPGVFEALATPAAPKKRSKTERP